MSDLRVLGELIIESIKTIESRFNHEDIDFPALANPFNGERKAESILLEPEISTARSYIVAAASQLIAMVRSPVQTMVENGLVFHLPSCIRAAVESNMVEIIREAGSQGIHANDIAKRTIPIPQRLRGFFVFSQINHIFTEISPDVFCLNRLSSVLDSGKTVVNYRRTRIGISTLPGSLRSYQCKPMRGLRGRPTLLKRLHIAIPHIRRGRPTHRGHCRANKRVSFDWYDRPENSHLKTRFSFAMACSTKLEPPQ
ncbi:hypothetical protein B0H14DRAFT_3144380, partial [Mycena olivaceomarginata]